MGANFTPDMQGYTSMKPFRFWCQKVLPTIYDDSLSYYEVLCKLVKYLNTVIENMEKVEANVDALLNAFNLLQSWVNEYFDNLDVQDEIDDKIDRMVEDGTFDRWIEPIIQNYEGDLQTIYNQFIIQAEQTLDDYEDDAREFVKEAEAWAKGTKDGVPVTSSEEQYHDNSKYWAEQAQQSAGDASGVVGTVTTLVNRAEDAVDDAENWSKESEAWAKGTKDGVPVTSSEEQYHDNSKYWAEQAEQDALDSEAWAKGTKDGVPVTSQDEQYEDNAKYWAEQAQQAATGTDLLQIAKISNYGITNKLTVRDTYTTQGSVTIAHSGLVVIKIPDAALRTGHNEQVGTFWRLNALPYYIPVKPFFMYSTPGDGLGTLDQNPDYIAIPYHRMDNITEGGVSYLIIYSLIYNIRTGTFASNGETLHLVILNNANSLEQGYSSIYSDISA